MGAIVICCVLFNPVVAQSTGAQYEKGFVTFSGECPRLDSSAALNVGEVETFLRTDLFGRVKYCYEKLHPGPEWTSYIFRCTDARARSEGDSIRWELTIEHSGSATLATHGEQLLIEMLIGREAHAFIEACQVKHSKLQITVRSIEAQRSTGKIHIRYAISGDEHDMIDTWRFDGPGVLVTPVGLCSEFVCTVDNGRMGEHEVDISLTMNDTMMDRGAIVRVRVNAHAPGGESRVLQSTDVPVRINDSTK